MNCFCCNQTNWFVAVISGLLEFDKQAQGWERVKEFDGKKFLSVPWGHYVELNFTIRGHFPGLCLWGFYLEIRDGSNQSTNLLGEFCGDYGTGVVRSSGRYMWLKFMRTDLYNFAVFYTARSINETGMFLLINQYICIYTPVFKSAAILNYIWKYLYLCLYIKKCLFLIRKKKIYIYICMYIYIKYCQTCNVYIFINWTIMKCNIRQNFFVLVWSNFRPKERNNS